jgi:hypothetical protein
MRNVITLHSVSVHITPSQSDLLVPLVKTGTSGGRFNGGAPETGIPWDSAHIPTPARRPEGGAQEAAEPSKATGLVADTACLWPSNATAAPAIWLTLVEGCPDRSVGIVSLCLLCSGSPAI